MLGNQSIARLVSTAWSFMMQEEFNFFNIPDLSRHENNAHVNESLKKKPHSKRKHKRKPYKNNGSSALHIPLNIGSINVGGALADKIPYINKKLLKEGKGYDILVLLETHTFYGDKQWLQTAFPHYMVYCEGSTKSSVFKAYRERKEKEAMALLNPKERAKHMAEINEYQSGYSSGVIVLIKHNIKKYFVTSQSAPDHRGITLTTKDLYSQKNINFHFVYAPSKDEEKDAFWAEFAKTLKALPEEDHFIIGDLNMHLNIRDSNSSIRKVPAEAESIIEQLGLVETP